ncbi:hypothetical protein BJP34_12865 [Moorena producens PAL-8-15-08-1]|uniref:DUF928 domain-containing protein n=1 Tax=Moorena producens PAL-8-15-08-1 TaxID=1458985 RepID=A0A1D8TRP0_9CYAN|nr:DUF928 domain-containing protein [Moorena producens]AOX00223.1 hypothetical protein BJP34_12865 [Moorena producens PAL-8-15-08-1]
MNRNKFRLQKVIIALTLSWLFSFESHIVKAIEAIEPLTNLLKQGENTLTPIAELPVPVKLELTLPPKGAPGKRKGAGSRNDCPFEEFIALVPGTNFGLTTSERPTFWFYVSSSQSRRWQAQFWLQDKEGNQVYQETFRLQNTPGIVKITLPETVSPLVVEDLYRWHFSVICNGTGRLKDDFVYGGVERISITSDLEKQLEGKNPRKRIAVYAQQGLWFDALTSLAELRLANPEDKSLDQDWMELLQQVGLEEIDSKPLVDCCTAEN